MKKIDVEMALLGEQNALDNTWNNKFNKVVPDFQREGSVLKFTANNSREIGRASCRERV